MDPNSTFLLKIKFLENPKKVRKDVGCFAFEKVVDCDLINYKDFIESIVEQYRQVIWKLHIFSTMMRLQKPS